MPPKRKGRGGAAARRGRGGRGGARGAKRQKRASTSEDEQVASENEEVPFDKNVLQTVKYDYAELLSDPSFNHPEFVHCIEPEDLNMDYFNETGLEHPLLFHCDPKLIGMTVPDNSFTVDDVLQLIGGKRIIEVVEVTKQASQKMTLEAFVNFYKTPASERKALYNVLSLEFSQTPMQDLVKSPGIVREIDWVGNMWPDALRQRSFTFNRRDRTYFPHHTFPKVQNYCLMSVGTCYTDFHIDFSGSSVWYHVLKGQKVFWLIPPTETNLMLYEEYTRNHDDLSFFGKSVEKCHRAVLNPGDTMLIPSGWIHAVYTPIDSLVFGGNFVHSLSCKMQIRVYQCENKLNISRKFRLPYNEELLFYVLAHYVKKCTGREYVRPLRIEDAKQDYVGDKWIENGGHRKPVNYEDFVDHGVEIKEPSRECTPVGEGEIQVIAMHAENTLYSLADSALEDEADEDGKVEKSKEVENDHDAEIDEAVKNNPLVFYKNSKHDFVRNKCVPDHKLPLSEEPPINYIQDEMDKISPRLLEELEELSTYLRRKRNVEIAEGICQPASLLSCFTNVLSERKAQLTGEARKVAPPRKRLRSSMTATAEAPPLQRENSKKKVPEDHEYSPELDVEMTHTEDKIAEKVKRMPAGQDEGAPNDTEEASKSEEADDEKKVEGAMEVDTKPELFAGRANSRFKVEDFPEELLEGDEPLQPLLIPKLSPTFTSGVLLPAEMTKKEIKDDYFDNEEEEEPKADQILERTKRRARRSEKKDEDESAEGKEPEKEESEEKKEPHKKTDEERAIERERKIEEKRRAREKRAREAERKRKSSHLDAALNAAHGNVVPPKSKKKPDKPQFVGGLPVAPIQNEPVVSNPYNYDPMAVITRLGTGQLKSAYRKSKTNIEPPKDKKMYKLEPKRPSEDVPPAQNLSDLNGDETETRASTSSWMPSLTSPVPSQEASLGIRPIEIDTLMTSPPLRPQPHSKDKKDKDRDSRDRRSKERELDKPRYDSDANRRHSLDAKGTSDSWRPRSDHSPVRHEPMYSPGAVKSERKKSAGDANAPHHRRQITYSTPTSRLASLIATPVTPGNVPTGRHGSISEKKPAHLSHQATAPLTPRSSIDSTPYTPTAPSVTPKHFNQPTSWLHPAELEMMSTEQQPPVQKQASSVEEDEIDVVNDAPNHAPSGKESSSPTTPANGSSTAERAGPVGGRTSHSMDSVSGSVNGSDRRRSTTPAEKPTKIAASVAIDRLTVLVARLNAINEK